MTELPDALRDAKRAYWRTNVLIMSLLLAVWAFVGLGCGILWADWLNQFRLGGVPLGFWFAQQGSIATFVLIILVYAILMNRLDSNFHRDTRHLREQPGNPPAGGAEVPTSASTTGDPDAVSNGGGI